MTHSVRAYSGLRQGLAGLDAVNRSMRLVIGLLLLIATACVALQIVVRFVFTVAGLYVAAPWTEEIARYAVIWSSFLGVAYLCRGHALISVDALPHIVAPPLGRAIRVATALVCIGFFGWLFWLGQGWSMTTFERSPVLTIPMWWIYVALPVGAAIAIVNLAAYVAEVLLLGRDPLADATDTATE